MPIETNTYQVNVAKTLQNYIEAADKALKASGVNNNPLTQFEIFTSLLNTVAQVHRTASLMEAASRAGGFVPLFPVIGLEDVTPGEPDTR